MTVTASTDDGKHSAFSKVEVVSPKVDEPVDPAPDAPAQDEASSQAQEPADPVDPDGQAVVIQTSSSIEADIASPSDTSGMLSGSYQNFFHGDMLTIEMQWEPSVEYSIVPTHASVLINGKEPYVGMPVDPRGMIMIKKIRYLGADTVTGSKNNPPQIRIKFKAKKGSRGKKIVKRLNKRFKRLGFYSIEPKKLERDDVLFETYWDQGLLTPRKIELVNEGIFLDSSDYMVSGQTSSSFVLDLVGNYEGTIQYSI